MSTLEHGRALTRELEAALQEVIENYNELTELGFTVTLPIFETQTVAVPPRGVQSAQHLRLQHKPVVHMLVKPE